MEFRCRVNPSLGGLTAASLLPTSTPNTPHALFERQSGNCWDRRLALQQAALGQEAITSAPAVFVVAAAYQRTAVKYGSRAARYVQIESGHACQNLLLQAAALNLAGVPIGAFNDGHVVDVIKLPNNERPLYLVPVGYPSE
ncbi:nitroreductase family protein [Methylomarinum sp. Ch1-1]|uniref:Nitroreductase family protein n=1 Tax=Methylomarinum roseum TaxID=3067653 RepID=A0AAU7NYP0_9GAMM|nr:nitroreductase family protein [Methylomarinum sp. Ch1-1]MDP4521881.1 nitroreductase family protein [Methylomarinum sp. Ch1-1]